MIAKFYLVIALLVPAHVANSGDNTALADVPDTINIHVLSQAFDTKDDCEAFAKIPKAASSDFVTDGPTVATECVNIPQQ